MIGPADIEAVIRFLPTAEGGRQTPCRSGVRSYRCPCDFGLDDGWSDALFEFVDKEWVAPGESVVTRMWFVVAANHFGRLCEGFDFTVHEGLRLVARGRITKVLNKDLEKKQ